MACQPTKSPQESVSARTFTVWGTDLNDGFGKKYDAKTKQWIAEANESVGTANAQEEKGNAFFFRRWLEEQHLKAVNCFFGTADTYFGSSGDSKRLDYIVVPVDHHHQACQCHGTVGQAVAGHSNTS